MSRIDTSAPAHMTMPGARDRADYTFRDERLMEISAGNAHLLKRLEAVATRKGGGPAASGGAAGTGAAAARPRAPPKSSAAVNRDRRSAEIDRANAAMLARLQGAKSVMRKAMAPPASLSAPVARSWAGAALVGPSGGAGGGGGGGSESYYDMADADGVSAPPDGMPGGFDYGGHAAPPPPPYMPLRAAAAHVSAVGAAAAAASATAAAYPATRPGAMTAPRLASRSDGTMTAAGGRRRVGVPPVRGATGERDLRDVALHASRDDYLRY